MLRLMIGYNLYNFLFIQDCFGYLNHIKGIQFNFFLILDIIIKLIINRFFRSLI